MTKEAFVKFSLVEVKHLLEVLLGVQDMEQGSCCEDCEVMIAKMRVVVKGLSA